MNVVKCVNGHFFDGDKYELCPQCGALESTEETSSTTESSKAHALPWRKKKRTEKVRWLKVPDKTFGKTFGVLGKDKTKSETDTESTDDGEILMCSVCGSAYDPHINSSCPNCANSDSADKEDNYESGSDEIGNKGVPIAVRVCPRCNQKYNQFSLEDEGCPQCGFKAQNCEESDCDSSESLSDAVRKAVAGNDGKTRGFFSSGRIENCDVNNEPVVGWLVCIKGVHFGETFAFWTGRNSIGRNGSNKVIFDRDETVSRDKHAWLTYEPKRREFFIQPGESSGLIYLNGDTVMESKKIKAKDVLEVGNGQYLLIPLCDETFSWEDYIGKE